MQTATKCHYCKDPAVGTIRTIGGLLREVCAEHRHSFYLQRGCSLPEDAHVEDYCHWRHDAGLPPIPFEDAKTIIKITRVQEGYEFAKWER